MSDESACDKAWVGMTEAEHTAAGLIGYNEEARAPHPGSRSLR